VEHGGFQSADRKVEVGSSHRLQRTPRLDEADPLQRRSELPAQRDQHGDLVAMPVAESAELRRGEVADERGAARVQDAEPHELCPGELSGRRTDHE
jgi:hypothetical protein